MKLIRQTSLYQQSGARLLIYEIDLCEVGPDEFVVNFRQGQAGRALKDGTKTILPVREARAERLFGDLVASLLEKGYSTQRPAPGLPPSPAAPVVVPPAADPIAFEYADDGPSRMAAELLSRLRNDGSGHDMDRVIWRIGQYRVTAAAPMLEAALEGASSLRYRTIAAALARIAAPPSESVFRRLAERNDRAVRRMGQEGLRAVLTGQALELERDRWRGQLTVELSRAGGDALVHAIQRAAETHADAVGFLYLLDDPAGRAALLQWLKTVPFTPPYFRVVRDLFKRAEVRDDGEIFGMIAHRVETTRGRHGYSEYNRKTNRWVPYSELVKDANNTKYAFSRATRRWWRRRIWRAFEDRAKAQQADAFCRMAAGYLKQFTNATAGPHGLKAWALGRLLHAENSNVWHDGSHLRHSRGSQLPIDRRNEAWPEHWDACPQYLVELVCEAQSAAVFTFALRALKANRSAWGDVPLDRLLELIAHPRRSVVDLAVEIAVSRHDPHNPNHALVGAIALCETSIARQAAHAWLRADPRRYLADTDLMLRLLQSAHEDTCAVAVELVDGAPPSTRDALVDTLFARLDAEPGGAVTGLFEDATARGQIDASALLTLLSRVPQLAARLAVGHHGTPDDNLVAELLRHSDGAIRAAGIELLGRLPDHVLTQRYAALVHLCTHADAATRTAMHPLIGRLAAGHSAFAESILNSLIEILRQPEAHDGLHDDLVRLIQQALGSALTRIDTAQVLRLAQSNSPAVHRLIEGRVLALSAYQIDLDTMVTLADHPAVAIRRHAWQLLGGQVSALTTAPDHLLRLVDAEWDDARAFAFAFIQERFTRLPPLTLVGLCDSVRPDVQQFGQRMINRLFDDADGATYLRMLSQHPAPGVQLFVTNLLSRYARTADDLRQLEPYFRAVLMAVHRGKAAKTRVLRFLRAQALADAQMAAVIAPIFADVSASSQVGLHGAAVESLVAIRAQWPQIDTPLATIEPAFRGARGVR
jgi:hypothetical protein